jgi:hypothetical protein
MGARRVSSWHASGRHDPVRLALSDTSGRLSPRCIHRHRSLYGHVLMPAGKWAVLARGTGECCVRGTSDVTGAGVVPGAGDVRANGGAGRGVPPHTVEVGGRWRSRCRAGRRTGGGSSVSRGARAALGRRCVRGHVDDLGRPALHRSVPDQPADPGSLHRRAVHPDGAAPGAAVGSHTCTRPGTRPAELAGERDAPDLAEPDRLSGPHHLPDQ